MLCFLMLLWTAEHAEIHVQAGGRPPYVLASNLQAYMPA